MNAVVVGPFIFSAYQFAALVSIFVFIVLTTTLAWRVDPGIGKWSGWALTGSLVAARAGHVALHWQ